MKHKVKVITETKKRGLLGIPRTVREEKVITVDEKTFRRMKKEQKNQPYTIEEMVLYDLLLDDD